MRQGLIGGRGRGLLDEVSFDGHSASGVGTRRTSVSPGPVDPSAFKDPAEPTMSRPYEPEYQQTPASSSSSVPESSISSPCHPPMIPPRSYHKTRHSTVHPREARLHSIEKATWSPRDPTQGSGGYMPDPEKAFYEQRSMRHGPSSKTNSQHATIEYREEHDRIRDDGPKKHALWILVGSSCVSGFDKSRKTDWEFHRSISPPSAPSFPL